MLVSGTSAERRLEELFYTKIGDGKEYLLEELNVKLQRITFKHTTCGTSYKIYKNKLDDFKGCTCESSNKLMTKLGKKHGTDFQINIEPFKYIKKEDEIKIQHNCGKIFKDSIQNFLNKEIVCGKCFKNYKEYLKDKYKKIEEQFKDSNKNSDFELVYSGISSHVSDIAMIKHNPCGYTQKITSEKLEKSYDLICKNCN